VSGPRPSSLEALRIELEGLPAHPIGERHPRFLWFWALRTLDFATHTRFRAARFLSRMRPYPKPFRHVRFRTEDGVHIAGWLAPQPRMAPSRWGLIIAPGLFATKDDAVHRGRAVAIHERWRIPVLAIDLRAFGESTGIATAGWKEALDIAAAAKFLATETGVQRVAVLAESLAGAAALNALAYDSQSNANLLTGGVLCWSAFVDAKDAVAHISQRPERGDRFYKPWNGFRRLLRFRFRGAYERFDDFLEDAARVNNLKGLEELLDLANPKWKVPLIRAPTLLVHARDDPVVPVRHAETMQVYAAEKPNIQVLVTTWGSHAQFEPKDPLWFWEVSSRFFGFVNQVELPNLARATRRTRPPPDTPVVPPG
jgi:pimeloyl-ACP methyl ester carboxylesterase